MTHGNESLFRPKINEAIPICNTYVCLQKTCCLVGKTCRTVIFEKADAASIVLLRRSLKKNHQTNENTNKSKCMCSSHVVAYLYVYIKYI